MQKPTRSILDSYALLALLFRERGFEQVEALLEWAGECGEMHRVSAVNRAEVRYMVERKMGAVKWPEVREVLAGLPLEIVPADKPLAEQAAEFKAKGGMSLADCFAAALARAGKLPVCTGDPEFKKVAAQVEVVWL